MITALDVIRAAPDPRRNMDFFKFKRAYELWLVLREKFLAERCQKGARAEPEERTIVPSTGRKFTEVELDALEAGIAALCRDIIRHSDGWAVCAPGSISVLRAMVKEGAAPK